MGRPLLRCRYPYFSQNAHADAGNGMLVQQAMQQSYARQTGVLPPAAGAQQQAGAGAAGQLAPTTRVKWGVEANDDDFKEVIGQDVREQKQMWQDSLRVQFDGSAPMDDS